MQLQVIIIEKNSAKFTVIRCVPENKHESIKLFCNDLSRLVSNSRLESSMIQTLKEKGEEVLVCPISYLLLLNYHNRESLTLLNMDLSLLSFKIMNTPALHDFLYEETTQLNLALVDIQYITHLLSKLGHIASIKHQSILYLQGRRLNNNALMFATISTLKEIVSAGSKLAALELGLLCIQQNTNAEALKWLYPIKDDQNAAFLIGRILIQGDKSSVVKGRAYLESVTLEDKKYLVKFWLAMSYTKEDEQRKEKLLNEIKDHLEQAAIELEKMVKNKKPEDRLDVVSLKKKAKEGDLQSKLILAKHFQSFPRVEGFPKQAYRWFRDAAKHDDHEAQFQLGVCFEKGFGIEANSEEAKQWFTKAAPFHKGAWAKLNPWRMPKIFDWLYGVPAVVRTFCRTKTKTVTKVNSLPIVSSELKIQPKKPKNPKEPRKQESQREESTDDGAGIGLTSFNLHRALAPSAKQKTKPKLKIPLLSRILNEIQKGLPNEKDWSKTFNLIKKIYNPNKIKNNLPAKEFIKSLFSNHPVAFFNFLIQLKKEKSIDLVRKFFPGFDERCKKLTMNGYNVLEWIGSEIIAGKKLSNILFAVILHENKGGIPEKVFDYHLTSATGKVLGNENIDKKSVEECILSLQTFIANASLAQLEELRTHRAPSYDEQLDEKYVPAATEASEYSTLNLKSLFCKLNGSEKMPLKKLVAKAKEQIKEKTEAKTELKSEPIVVFEQISLEKEKKDPTKEELKKYPKEMQVPNYKVYIPPDAYLIMKSLAKEGYIAYMDGSRVYNPIVSEYDDKIRDVDLVTNAPKDVVERILAHHQFQDPRFPDVKTDSGTVNLCKTKSPSKEKLKQKFERKFDIRFNANLDPLTNDIPGHDMTYRSGYANLDGDVFDPSGCFFKDNQSNKINFFDPGALKLFSSDPARILETIFAISCGRSLQPDDEKSLELALPALAKVVAENPMRLLYPLVKNLTRGNAKENFEWMVHYGVFNVLFPGRVSESTKNQLGALLGCFDMGARSGCPVSLPDIYTAFLTAHMSPFVDIDATIEKLPLIKCQQGKLPYMKSNINNCLAYMSQFTETQPFTLGQAGFFTQQDAQELPVVSVEVPRYA